MDRDTKQRSPSEVESDRRTAERRQDRRREHERVRIVDDGTDRRQQERREDEDR